MDITKERRDRWVRRYACEELLEELDSDRIPFRTVYRLAHLPITQQRHELAKRRGVVKAQELAAKTIDQFLVKQQQPENYEIALEILCGAITNAIARDKFEVIR